jgi:hypothetical protein
MGRWGALARGGAGGGEGNVEAAMAEPIYTPALSVLVTRYFSPTDEILTNRYVKLRVQWFPNEEDPRPTPSGSLGGSRAMPIGHARAHPLAKRPGRA